MTETPNLMPTGLSRSEFKSLCEYQHRAAELTAEQLAKKVDQHLELTRLAHDRNRLVNLQLAVALSENAHAVLGQWRVLAPDAKSWLAAAILYFAESQDDEPDFTSALGFEDDANIMNACLRHAGLNSMCVNTEDYDHA